MAAAAGVALLIIASVIASVASSRDEWSYHLGYSSGDTALKLVHEGETDQIACKDLLIGAEMPPPLGAEKSGHTIQTDDFMAGCFDSLHKLGG